MLSPWRVPIGVTLLVIGSVAGDVDVIVDDSSIQRVDAEEEARNIMKWTDIYRAPESGSKLFINFSLRSLNFKALKENLLLNKIIKFRVRIEFHFLKDQKNLDYRIVYEKISVINKSQVGAR